MSYASVAAENAPPLSQQVASENFVVVTLITHSLQPRPDPRLLNTVPSSTSAESEVKYPNGTEFEPRDESNHPQSKKGRGKKGLDHLRRTEREGFELWETAKQYLLRPSVAGGVVGLGTLIDMSLFSDSPSQANIGLLATAGRAFYNNPGYGRNPKIVSSTVAAAILVASVEGFAADRYHRTPEGREAERKAKEDGSLLYQHTREVILRPESLGGLVGVGLPAFAHYVNVFRLMSPYSQFGRLWSRGVLRLQKLEQISLGLERCICRIDRNTYAPGRRDLRCVAICKVTRRKERSEESEGGGINDFQLY
jgi:hypothetical protein